MFEAKEALPIHEFVDWMRHEVNWFYVSAIDGAKRCLIAGPYVTHEEALGDVERVKRIVCDADGRGDFMAWGTAGYTGPMIGAPRGNANLLVFRTEVN